MQDYIDGFYKSQEREVEQAVEEMKAGIRHELITMNMSSGARHTFMYKYAEQNKLKGKFGGDCNVTACQLPGAVWYNNGTDAYYCPSCAHDINESCKYSDFYPLCTEGKKEMARPIKVPSTMSLPHGKKKLGRNDPCSCGSGIKYKKCCL